VPLAGFEPTIPASEQPQTHALPFFTVHDLNILLLLLSACIIKPNVYFT
jgi:hypothetical protein